MSGLVLTLRPNEKFLVNGALLQNGPKQGQIHIKEDETSVLRLSDALHPDEVNTPVKQAYYVAQLILSRDGDVNTLRPHLIDSLTDLQKVFTRGEGAIFLVRALTAAKNGRYFSVISQLKKLIPVEYQLTLFASGQQTRSKAPELLSAAG